MRAIKDSRLMSGTFVFNTVNLRILSWGEESHDKGSSCKVPKSGFIYNMKKKEQRKTR